MYGLHMYGKNTSAAVAGNRFTILKFNRLCLIITFFKIGIAAVLVRQTSIVWVILVAIGCLDLGLQKLLLTAKDRKSHTLSSWHQVQVKCNQKLNTILMQHILLSNYYRLSWKSFSIWLRLQEKFNFLANSFFSFFRTSLWDSFLPLSLWLTTASLLAIAMPIKPRFTFPNCFICLP